MACMGLVWDGRQAWENDLYNRGNGGDPGMMSLISTRLGGSLRKLRYKTVQAWHKLRFIADYMQYVVLSTKAVVVTAIQFRPNGLCFMDIYRCIDIYICIA